MSAALSSDHLCVHSENPRYLQWHGKPVVLVGSGEHYGALINLDFDYKRYFAQLKREGLNITRVFSGASYVEPVGAFNITKNSLAPAEGAIPLHHGLWRKAGSGTWRDGMRPTFTACEIW